MNGDAGTIKRVHRLANGIELLPNSYDPNIRPIMFDYNVDDTPQVTIMWRVVYAVMSIDHEI